MTATEHLAEPTLARPAIAARQLFIGGRWVEAVDGGRTEIIDPSTTEVITTVAEAGAADIDAAVQAARVAGPAWAAMPARERGRILHRVSLLMRERADELVATESIDVGKPVSLCRPVDVTTAANQYEYYAGLAQAIEGSHAVHRLPGAGLHPARAARRRRGDHAVQLPADPQQHQARARAGGRQHRRAQAGRTSHL